MYMIVCAPMVLLLFIEKTHICVLYVMLTHITQEMKKLLSGFVFPAQQTLALQKDLEVNEIVSASQDLSLSHQAHTILIHAQDAQQAHSQAHSTPQHVTHVYPESFQISQHQYAQTAPLEVSQLKQECPRASPVLLTHGRTWMLEDT